MKEGQNLETTQYKKIWENRSAIITAYSSNLRVSVPASV